jgi:hypothetical protein
VVWAQQRLFSFVRQHGCALHFVLLQKALLQQWMPPVQNTKASGKEWSLVRVIGGRE